jgi:hypothetical protein
MKAQKSRLGDVLGTCFKMKVWVVGFEFLSGETLIDWPVSMI